MKSGRTRQAQRHQTEAELTEELPPLQQRKARKLYRVTEKQQNCSLRCPKWACGSVGENVAIVSPLQSGKANTRSPLHRKPPACSTNRVARPLGWYHHGTAAGEDDVELVFYTAPVVQRFVDKRANHPESTRAKRST